MAKITNPTPNIYLTLKRHIQLSCALFYAYLPKLRLNILCLVLLGTFGLSNEFQIQFHGLEECLVAQHEFVMMNLLVGLAGNKKKNHLSRIFSENVAAMQQRAVFRHM